MGSIEGFLNVERNLPESEKPEVRIDNYKEFYKPHNKELTTQQASRCMDCGVPFCHNGCPLGNLIPDFNDAVYNNQWEKATRILLATNNFPEFTGRICPAPCEGSCVLGINKPAVAIEHIEKSIIETAFERGYIKPRVSNNRNGKSVGVVGSGPAGLAAADQLNKAGYQVTVYERHEKAGGLLRFGIPDFKLEKWVVERRVELMEQEGVHFELNAEIGKDILANELFSKHEGMVLATGSTIPRDLPIPGRELKGVHFAMDFLTQNNRRVSKLNYETEDILAGNKNVLVIGGGDTGSDCIGTSNRQGAKSIVQLELLAKPPVGRAVQNPWPEWPLILRTSSSHEEGCEREWSVLTKRFVGNDKGELTGLETVKIKWEENKFEEIPGTEKTYPCDLAFLAIGFVHTQHDGLIQQLNLNLDNRGNVVSNQYQTKIPNVFVAGDMRRGQSLVVWAISEGREAARKLDHYLTEHSALGAKNRSEYQTS
jgi:glutamate synthase (NADPH/NADH) small chain